MIFEYTIGAVQNTGNIVCVWKCEEHWSEKDSKYMYQKTYAINGIRWMVGEGDLAHVFCCWDKEKS